MEKLPVIFRADKRGEFKGQVTAVFPTTCEDLNGAFITCYSHVGQHGSCTLSWYRSETRPARAYEYGPLLRELREIYGRTSGPDDPPYELEVFKRMTVKHREALRQDAARYRAAMREQK